MVPPRNLPLCVGCVTLCSNLFCFCDLLFCFVIIVSSPSFLLSFWSVLSPFGPTSWTHEGLLALFLLALSLPSSCHVFLLGLSCRSSVGRSTGHIIGLIVPANSNLVPWGLGLCPDCMLVLFRFVLFSFLLFSLLFLFRPCQSYFSCVRIYHEYVPGTTSLQLLRDRIPQLVNTVPLSTGTAMHVSFLFSSIKTLL